MRFCDSGELNDGLPGKPGDDGNNKPVRRSKGERVQQQHEAEKQRSADAHEACGRVSLHSCSPGRANNGRAAQKFRAATMTTTMGLLKTPGGSAVSNDAEPKWSTAWCRGRRGFPEPVATAPRIVNGDRGSRVAAAARMNLNRPA
jgi:hypothetical protein